MRKYLYMWSDTAGFDMPQMQFLMQKKYFTQKKHVSKILLILNLQSVDKRHETQLKLIISCLEQADKV